MTDRTGLAGEAAAGNRGVDVVLVLPGRRDDGLLQDHLQHRTGEEGVEFLAVHGDLAVARLDPHAGDGVLALAGRIGAALGIELLHVDRASSHRGGDGLEIFERVDGIGHNQSTVFCVLLSRRTFLLFMAPTSSLTGCCASCG